MATFPPSTAVLTSVRVTKALYAQLVSQRFHAPKPFLHDAEWSKLTQLSPTSDEYKWADLGMKIACGFEILMTDKMYSASKFAMDMDGVVSGAATSTYPFERDEEWSAFYKKLSHAGYFKVDTTVVNHVPDHVGRTGGIQEALRTTPTG